MISTHASNRELYLRHVRELFRKQYSPPLRKALGVVERDIAAETFNNIDYNHVPSIAVDRYTSLFIRKDNERFAKYVDDVLLGASTISGVTLLPSTLVRKACETAPSWDTRQGTICRAQVDAMQKGIQRKVIDGQWRTLVESVRNAGVLQSSVAVCDVSGSMFGPKFNDGSTPLHSSIGLSLLISEVTSGPFGGYIITFSENPQVHDLRDAGHKLNGLCHTVEYVRRMGWGMNTNIVAVFEHLLEIAKAISVSQDEMVKQVFVFSDMQFYQGMDQAVWASFFDRIKTAYADAGYDMPKLVFWNLAGATSKPVTVDDQNTALVSGYSQGMLKAFLETGALDDVEENVKQAVEGENGMVEVKRVEKIDPLTAVKKAVEHKAYSMLNIVD
ncbi:hypothetical protein BU25DRAFT_453980 [Macroventuria anomochaeta]|uniref:Uncharacterized protein n=1 Tax=Macroventuria anomochaeta TaxID=301207 RepID=A0ACB6SHH0_9PLEO|nr:uncharacterized protein BU25DRAFT_453980 [Macroventuria anomochaeta]KAF2632798.1 hypothetical protein BU25DRAFT_453980 [Macroventuria anomochaeta]